MEHLESIDVKKRGGQGSIDEVGIFKSPLPTPLPPPGTENCVFRNNDDCLRRSRVLIEQAVWRCWSHLMGEVEGISGPEDLLRTVSRKSLDLSAGISRPALRIQLKGPAAPLAGFFARLDAFPFLDQWTLSAAKSISFSVIHEKMAAVLRTSVEPKKPEHACPGEPGQVYPG